MAKLIEQSLVITVSRLARNGEDLRHPLSAENLAEVASVVEALAGEGTIVEIEQIHTS